MHRYHPQARDAGMAKISRITTAVVAASAVMTLGLGAAIATAAPPPKAKKEKADFAEDKSRPAVPPVRTGGSQSRPGTQLQPPAERPESSSGDEETTSGGS